MLITFSYKFAIFAWILGDLVQIVIFCFLWVAVYAFSPTASINGFTLTTMLAYVVTSRIISNLVSSQSFFTVGEDIRTGSIANSLIKPINYRIALSFSSIGSYLGGFLVAFLPVYIPAIVILHFALGVAFPLWYNLLFFILSSFLAMLIIDAFDFMIGQMAFFTGALFGIMLVKSAVYGFLSGAMIPLSFFPAWAQNIFLFLPFASMLQTPAFIALGMYGLPQTLLQLGLQLFWVVFLNLLSLWTYAGSVKRVVSVGG